MRQVRVHLGERSYDIVIGSSLLEQIPSLFSEHGIGERIFLVSNTTVYDLFGERVSTALTQAGFRITQLLIPDGEKYKNLETVENMYTYLLAQKAERSSTLAALGGGVTGDVAGFVAATFLRGIDYVQIPTTLLAQVDSSVGGKTGVNHRLGKNIIGAFYQPSLVCIDTETLATLPRREFVSGLFEVAKYGLICDREFFQWFGASLPQIKDRSHVVLEQMISRCCEIKAEVISIDEREEDLRRILNFGHTLGHALEAATNFETVTHGEAVGYGMLAAARLSWQLGLLAQNELEEIEQCLLQVGSLPPIEGIPFQRLMDAIAHDKKRREDKTHFVLLKGIGKTVVRGDLAPDLLQEAWQDVVRKGEES